MQINDIIFMLTMLLLVLMFFWEHIYRGLFLPWRSADFKDRHWEYWFEKDMVAYSQLAGIRYKFEVARYGHYKNALRRVKDSTSFEPGILEPQVQIAYNKHVENKFEEIVLDVKE